MSWDASGDIGAMDSDAGTVDSGAVGSLDVPAVDVHAARAIKPATSSDVGFQDRKGVLLSVKGNHDV